MNWYIAKIVFQININQGEHALQFDESLRLIQADSLTSAYHHAFRIGESEESIFLNNRKEKVEWKFIDVADIYHIENLEHGAELHSNTYIDYHPDKYITHVKLRALTIRESTIVLS